MRCKTTKGFTLVEILVSLAIMSIVLGVMVQSAGASAANASRLRDRTIAQWVASNRIAEMRIAGTFPDAGSKTGKSEMLGQVWFWKTIVQKVEDDDLRRVDVQIRRDEGANSPIVTISGFIGHPRLFSQKASQP